MSIEINGNLGGCGLTFNDWLDVFLFGNDGVVGNPFADIAEHNNAEQRWWFQLAVNYRAYDNVPQAVKDGRGIGNWHDPKIVLITETILTPNRLGKLEGLPQFGSPYWDLPQYKRLRPFMENKRALKFYFSLFKEIAFKCQYSVYVTPYLKQWVDSMSRSRDLFLSEIKEVTRNSNPIVVNLSNYNVILATHKMESPEFHNTWHGYGWREYRKKFQEIVLGGISPNEKT